MSNSIALGADVECLKETSVKYKISNQYYQYSNIRATSSLRLRTRHNLDALWVNSEGG